MSFRQATLNSGHSPVTLCLPVATDEVWPKGALLLVDADGKLAECGADPTAVAGVALHAYGGTASIYDHTHGELGVPPGYALVMLARDDAEFTCKVIGTIGNLDVLDEHGVAVDTDGDWKLDIAEVTTKVVKVIRLLDGVAGYTPDRVVVRFLAAAVQAI